MGEAGTAVAELLEELREGRRQKAEKASVEGQNPLQADLDRVMNFDDLIGVVKKHNMGSDVVDKVRTVGAKVDTQMTLVQLLRAEIEAVDSKKRKDGKGKANEKEALWSQHARNAMEAIDRFSVVGLMRIVVLSS